MEITGGINDPQQFWQALGRLYDSTLKLSEAIERLQITTGNLAATAQSHENRFDKRRQ